MKVYIAGPMTGLKDFNYPAFNEAAQRWREAGWTVFNPAENFGGDTTRNYREYMREDLAMLQQADAIALLFGWRLSRGARYELLTAQLLGLVVYNADTMAQFDAPKIGTGFSGVLIA
jgi:hypothetical protein